MVLLALVPQAPPTPPAQAGRRTWVILETPATLVGPQVMARFTLQRLQNHSLAGPSHSMQPAHEVGKGVQRKQVREWRAGRGRGGSRAPP